jgi:hypothetical protein
VIQNIICAIPSDNFLLCESRKALGTAIPIENSTLCIDNVDAVREFIEDLRQIVEDVVLRIALWKDKTGFLSFL